MRTLVNIIAGVAILSIVILAGLIYYVQSKANKNKTAAARSARWQGQPAQADKESSVSVLNNVLDNLETNGQETKKESEL